MMLWLVAVAQCPCMHVLVCHIPPPQSSFARGVLAASQGCKIARQFTTLRFLKAGPRQILLPDRTDTDGLRNPHELPQVYETLMSYPKESVSRIVCRFKIYLKDYFM